MRPERPVAPESIVVRARGRVSSVNHAYARERIARAARIAARPVLFARVDLIVEEDAVPERPVLAKVEVDMSGQIVRAHATGMTVGEAVDRLEPRLHQRLARATQRRRSERLRHRSESEWRHGDPASARAPYYPRPLDDRAIVRRKTYAVGALTVEEAVDNLELLDHDFFLFENVETGEDNVVCRVEDGRYEHLAPSGPADGGTTQDRTGAIKPSARPVGRMVLDDALALLDLGNEPFVFYVDEDTAGGRVVYRRYDGHYGLITPAMNSGSRRP